MKNTVTECRYNDDPDTNRARKRLLNCETNDLFPVLGKPLSSTKSVSNVLLNNKKQKRLSNSFRQRKYFRSTSHPGNSSIKKLGNIHRDETHFKTCATQEYNISNKGINRTTFLYPNEPHTPWDLQQKRDAYCNISHPSLSPNSHSCSENNPSSYAVPSSFCRMPSPPFKRLTPSPTSHLAFTTVPSVSSPYSAAVLQLRRKTYDGHSFAENTASTNPLLPEMNHHLTTSTPRATSQAYPALSSDSSSNTYLGMLLHKQTPSISQCVVPSSREYSLSQHVPSTFESSISPPIDSAFFPFSGNHSIKLDPNVKTCQLLQLNKVGRTQHQSCPQTTSYNNYEDPIKESFIDNCNSTNKSANTNHNKHSKNQENEPSGEFGSCGSPLKHHIKTEGPEGQLNVFAPSHSKETSGSNEIGIIENVPRDSCDSSLSFEDLWDFLDGSTNDSRESSQQSVWDDNGGGRNANHPILPKHMAMPYTSEEENWLKHQVHIYNEAFQEVSLGKDFLNEFIMFTYDVPLSKTFGTRGYAVFEERFLRILKAHDGYVDLPTEEKKHIWVNGTARAIACCAAYSEHCTNGADQLTFMSGQIDKDTWERDYKAVVTKANKDRNLTYGGIQKIQMVDYNKVSLILNSEELTEYLRLIESLGEITLSHDIFQLVSLLTLFRGRAEIDAEDDCQQPSVKKGEQFAKATSNKYAQILQRKLKDDRQTLCKINIGVQDVDSLSVILRKLAT